MFRCAEAAAAAGPESAQVAVLCIVPRQVGCTGITLQPEQLGLLRSQLDPAAVARDLVAGHNTWAQPVQRLRAEGVSRVAGQLHSLLSCMLCSIC
jgi:hypothetical protein